MSFLPDELPVALDKLEDHLRAILKIKIREFVHLNPIFNCIPSIDVDIYNRNLADTANRVEQTLQPISQSQTGLKTQSSVGDSDDQAAHPVIDMPDSNLRTSLEPMSRSQFRKNILGNGQVTSRPPEEVPASPVPLSSKSYFAGFDIDCPNQSRQLPTRRRYSRRSTV